ncbi:acyltransferase family protein [Oceanicola granulosus HTCC2516]|uniref:Glycerol-3-phosphate acyltransferase n=1 Tax=Oceanicola granulosus (strain ATCC BAA-861 / DSM 15982 / KCTC 12143 / HTCC2516) TaxID=314256 RepID=Q2CI48_OCEGH|nr:acyltransferase family protein [Oceanicola granulosus HTCC2516]
MPLWLFLLILLFAAVTFASHFLFPSVRWFFRKRAERLVARLNTRLVRPIQPFKLARRHDMIQRLIYDPEVSQAIVEHATAQGVPENVAFEQARRYAREIVPSFSAVAYFSIGIRLARWLANSLYNVRIGRYGRDALEGVDPDATVVFVINHRSNMDYVLVTYLVSGATPLSYAVGEWARVWPLSAMIRMMGAFFIRRRTRNALYRKVLARYIQMATQGGVTQALFPEGGLSLDGRLALPKLGLLSYLLDDYDPDGREVVFVPVALNYDRVMEDRVLIRAAQRGERRFGVSPLAIVRTVGRHFGQRLSRRFKKFGQAGVSFGAPLALSEVVARGEDVADLGRELMRRIAAGMPAPPVPLVSRALLGGAHGADLAEAVAADLAVLDEAGVPRAAGSAAEVVERGLSRLRIRGLVDEADAASASAEPVLTFYANSIRHHFEDVPALRIR